MIRDTDSSYKFHGRRKGRPLRGARQEALNVAYQKFIIEDTDQQTINALIHNSEYKEIWFEVGFGNGEHLLWQAQQNPNKLMIGCEPFINGVSALAKAMIENDITNIRIWPDDAVILMNNWPENTLSHFFILHPDPWPKKRHHRRRFVQTDRLSQIATLLKKGAELRMASDDPELVFWMLEKAFHHPDYTWLAEKSSDWLDRLSDWPQTRYENKALEGRPYYLRFLRNA